MARIVETWKNLKFESKGLSSNILSSTGNLRRELWELRTSSPDLRDVGRDFSFSLCAVPLSDSCPKISERRDQRSEIERSE